MFKKSNKPTQKELIWNYLLTGRPITELDALTKFNSLGGYRARIAELKKEHPEQIDSKFVKLKSGKTVKKHWLKKEFINVGANFSLPL